LSAESPDFPKYQKLSLENRHFREALPRLDNYRISKRALKRPSMGELHGDPDKRDVSKIFEVALLSNLLKLNLKYRSYFRYLLMVTIHLHIRHTFNWAGFKVS
jgi:hypothetical protein